MLFHLRTTLELNNDGGIGDLFVVLRHLMQKALPSKLSKLCPGKSQMLASKLDNGVVQAVL